MPTYEYSCKFCREILEVFQNMTEPALKKCPICKKSGVQRLISGGASIIFKGGGFYETDYKKSQTKENVSPPKKETTSDQQKAPDSKIKEVSKSN